MVNFLELNNIIIINVINIFDQLLMDQEADFYTLGCNMLIVIQLHFIIEQSGPQGSSCPTL